MNISVIPQPNEYSGAYNLIGKKVILKLYYKKPIEGILNKNGHEPYNVNGIYFWPVKTYHKIKYEGETKEILGGAINGREIDYFCGDNI